MNSRLLIKIDSLLVLSEFNDWAANKATSLRTSSKGTCQTELTDSLLTETGPDSSETESLPAVMSEPTNETSPSLVVLVSSINVPKETCCSAKLIPSDDKCVRLRRAMRCGKCSGCLAADCRVCYACRLEILRFRISSSKNLIN